MASRRHLPWAPPREPSSDRFCTPQSLPEYWSKLPAEISLMILDKVIEDYKFQPSIPYLRAGYATVCREWQPVFEQQNFRRLVLDYDRIGNLENFTAKNHRRGYLEQILLCVRLDEYDCSVCQTKEDDDRKDWNNYLFSSSLGELLDVLSQWTILEPSPGRYGRSMKGLELELGAYSPSDCRHTFRDFHLEPNYPYQENREVQTYLDEAYHQRIEQMGSFNDQFHGWVEGRRDSESVICLEAKQRLMGTLELKWGSGKSEPFITLPEVEVVTYLLIRRQFYRKISGYSIGMLLSESFTNLIEFRREGWFDVDAQQQLEFDEGFNLHLCLDDLPSTLRNFYIFEESNNILHLPDHATRRIWRWILGKNLSYSSRLLENISVAFLIDVKDFLSQFWPRQNWDFQESEASHVVPWENLRSLTLTSESLRTSQKSIVIKNLLTAACRAVAFMPKLEVLEIWNATLKDGDPTKTGRPGTASVFRYEYKNKNPTITFSTNSVWLHKIVSEVLQGHVGSCWENLLRHKSGIQLTYTFEKIRGMDWCRTYPSVMEHLKLQGRVLHELSRCQMACENPIPREEDTKPNIEPAGT
ncbi:hypothetical protein LSUB1_G007075 [Lachnellula subtilissima]|uniref:DUF6546 domain-containing protein n=1 Tax=Lachnellula subtilissima TaxID=602034 RepID=A0A8H8RFC0_9HELO|nr:hypothetical protein LSUB1_G007075 [Lachnellula subtilissima]